MKNDETSLRVHQSVLCLVDVGGRSGLQKVKVARHLRPEHVPFWVEPRLINREFVLPYIFYEDPIRGTLLLARRSKNEVYPPDRKDSPSLDPSRCSGVWFRPNKKIAQQLKAVEQDMVDVFERIKTKTEVAGDMPLAGYLCQLWDHFLWTLASPTRTFGALEKPVPLLSVSEPHMQNALANKALGRSYKTGALACQGKLLVPSEKPQSSTKTDKVSKRAAEKGRSALRIMSSDEDEDEDSSGDKARNGKPRLQVLRRGEKEGFAAASKFAQGRQGTLDSNTNESLKRLRELRAAAERLPGRSTEASKAGMKVTIHGLQRLDEDAAIYQRNLVKTTVAVTRDDRIAGLRGHISSSKEVAEAMQYDEENLDGAEFAGTKPGGGFSATQGDILHSLNGFMRKNSHPEVEKLFGDYDSSEEEFFGSTTPADDDLYDWMPIY